MSGRSHPRSRERAPAPYSADCDLWPGVAGLAREAAEAVQVAGKITAGDDRPVLRERLQQKLGDLRAAIDYVVRENGLDWDAINQRRDATRARLQRKAASGPGVTHDNHPH